MIRTPRHRIRTRLDLALKVGVPLALVLLLGFQNCDGSFSGATAPTSTSAQAPLDSANAPLLPQSTGAPSSPSVPACTSITQLTIGMYGDSTMYGSTCSSHDSSGACVYTQSPTNEPGELQKLLSAKFPCAKLTVRNHGVGGSKASDWLYNDGPVQSIGPNATWQQLMADADFADEKIVLMNVAINDAFVLNVAPSVYTSNANVQMLTADLFANYYQSFAAAAVAQGKIFVMDGPNPITDTGHNPLLQSLVAAEKQFAQQARLTYVDQYWTIANTFANWPAYLPDGVHPDANLYASKASFTFNALLPTLTALGLQ